MQGRVDIVRGEGLISVPSIEDYHVRSVAKGYPSSIEFNKLIVVGIAGKGCQLLEETELVRVV